MGSLIPFLWAKKDESEGDQKWLPLLWHLEDTGHVSAFLWDHWLSEGQRKLIANGEDLKLGRKVVIFLGLIHDLGKASPAFQMKSNFSHRSDLDSVLLERLEGAGAKGISELKLAFGKESPHNMVGEVLLREFAERFERNEDISSIVGGHHGRPCEVGRMDDQLTAFRINYFQSESRDSSLARFWEENQREILDWALQKAGFHSAEDIPQLSMPAQVQALGLLTMADWIASNVNYFPLLDLFSDESSYCQSRVEQGMLKWFHSLGWEPALSDNISEDFLHRFSFKPREVQRRFLETISNCWKPGLFILEAPMGLGKTEAALMGAEALAAITGRSGVFFGLPTQATSNGIFPRMEEWIEGLCKDSDSKLGFRLIHGKASLNEEYAQLTEATQIGIDTKGYEAFVSNQWFSGKKTSILDDFVVGTVDQFLMAALKQKHLALRQLGLAKKVIVIDEVHAYDAYMSQYLQMALTWMASFRVPVILLSATLSNDSRIALSKAYLSGLGVPTNKMEVEGKSLKEFLSTTAYPLITYTDGEQVRQVCDFSAEERKTIDIIRIGDEELRKVIDQIFVDGGNIGIIVNTVKYAQQLAEELSHYYGEDMVELLHSSFLATERVQKEANLMQMLGKAEESERPDRKIIVGTQVIEQSLDIDFDVMISELAPIDLLIQRLGRLHRHKRDRPRGCQRPVLYLLGCSEKFEFQDGSKAVYGGYLLARSQCFLRDQITLPDDISPLVQAVYGEEELDLSEDMREQYCKFQDESQKIKREKEARAKTYRLEKPQLKKSSWKKADLHKWIENPPPFSSDEGGSAQVRDTDESIEVVALKKTQEGYCTLFTGEEYFAGEHLTREKAMRLARETLCLPRPLCRYFRIEETIRELETIYRDNFSEWDSSTWLKGNLGILFDDQMECELNGVILHYDRRQGLSYREKEKLIGTV